MAKPRTPDLSDAHRVLNSFRSIVKSLRLADRAGLKDHGLGASQLYVLHELKQESPLSVSVLAERTATDQSTVSVVVSKLIEKGFVSGKRAENDARRLDLELTAKGRRTVQRLPPPIQHTLIESVQELPRSKARALADTLQEIVHSLGADEENPPMLFDDGVPPAKKKAPAKRATKRRAR